MVAPHDRAAHWDDAYRALGVENVSWFEPEPTMSLALLDALGTRPEDAVLDVGGGASTLVDHLVDRGFGDVTVLDVSVVALQEGQARVGPDARVGWLREDLLSWRPPRRYDVWHDRAVFHFLTDPADRRRYLGVLADSVAAGGAVIIGTFAADGPQSCSGLPVARYSPADLCQELGPLFQPLACKREVHVTPTGVLQPFTWVAGRLTEGTEA
jgi:SAM-dependent methyltransferase